ncbi:otoconin-90-like [Tachyglossus aculeatus]|uniref:otoconin-90-like n=1 Tax=Tachyglossus aculeatus TaxID=9261 RepID=UPI0018F33675|nr:otoconin-90-like [Tachyglossus aculeatus]
MAVPVLDTTELPSRTVDLLAVNLTELVNGMLSRALKGSKTFFSLLSVTSYSSFAFQKLSVAVYNISTQKRVNPTHFPTRYCYCLNNKTNDLTDFTALLVDIIGNSTSYLKEIFKSTSILSVSQSNETDCIYICVMTGSTGRNLSEFWEMVEKSPLINYTFSSNTSGALDVESILPSLKTIQEEREKITMEEFQQNTHIGQTMPVEAQVTAPQGPQMPPSRIPLQAQTAGLQGPEVEVSFWVGTRPSQGHEAPSSRGPPRRPSPSAVRTTGRPPLPSPAPGTFALRVQTTTDRPTKAPAPRPQSGFPPSPLSSSEFSPPPLPKLHLASRCPQLIVKERAVTSTPLTGSAPKINPCVMELCRFFQKCLCVGPVRYSTKDAVRFCVERYSWFLKNATFICQSVKRTSDSHSGQEPDTPDLPSELPLGPARNINHTTLFSGVFKNVESVTLFFDCLGSHFTWLQAIFTNFPALLHFVSKLKCVTSLCPKDLEDYGCSCRFEMEGLPVDGTDRCCFQHRRCYEEASELECVQDPAQLSLDVGCVSQNITCESSDSCQQLLCLCDKAAIECFAGSNMNSSLNGLDPALCLGTGTSAELPAPSLWTSQPAALTVSPGARAGRTAPAPPGPEDSPTLPGFRPTGLAASSPEGLHPEGSPDPGTRFQVSGVILAPSEPSPATTPAATLVSSPATSPTKKETGRPTEKPCARLTFRQLDWDGQVKRELSHLGEMLFCLTQRCPEEFESVGCFCGPEERGASADTLDRCCFSHHCCLEQVKTMGCELERSSRMEVVCLDHKPECIGWNLCEKLLCSCDQTAAECLAAASFNTSLPLPRRPGCRDTRAVCPSRLPGRPFASVEVGSRSSSSEESSEEADPPGRFLRRLRRFVVEPLDSAGYSSRRGR